MKRIELRDSRYCEVEYFGKASKSPCVITPLTWKNPKEYLKWMIKNLDRLPYKFATKESVPVEEQAA